MGDQIPCAGYLRHPFIYPDSVLNAIRNNCDRSSTLRSVLRELTIFLKANKPWAHFFVYAFIREENVGSLYSLYRLTRVNSCIYSGVEVVKLYVTVTISL